MDLSREAAACGLGRAATVLLVLRQPTPTVMSLMGWSRSLAAVPHHTLSRTVRRHTPTAGNVP